MKNQLKRSFALLLVVALLGGAMGSALAAAPDVAEGYWGASIIDTAIEYGIIQGDTGTGNVRPEAPVKRGEFFAMLNRAFGFVIKEENIPFADYDASKWYAGDIAAAAAQGYLKGAASGDFIVANAEGTITRAEAFALLRRIARIAAAGVSTFDDADQIPAWFVGDIAAMQKAGYVNGSNNLVKPNDTLKRVEAVAAILNVAGSIINVAGEIELDAVAKNLTITAADVVVNGGTVGGNVYITEGVGDGDVHLNDVVIEGKLIIAGGGANSIYVNGGEIGGGINVASQPHYLGHATHVVLSGNNNSVVVNENAAATITAEDGATIDSLDITAGASALIEGEVAIANVNVADGSALVVGNDVVFDSIALGANSELSLPLGYDLTGVNMSVKDGSLIAISNADDTGIPTIYKAVIDDDGEVALFEVDPETGELADEAADLGIELTITPEPVEPTEPEEGEDGTDPAEEEEEEDNNTSGGFVPPPVTGTATPEIKTVTEVTANTAVELRTYKTSTHTDNLVAVTGGAGFADDEVTVKITTNVNFADLDPISGAAEIVGDAKSFLYTFDVAAHDAFESHSLTLTHKGKTASYYVVYGGADYQAELTEFFADAADVAALFGDGIVIPGYLPVGVASDATATYAFMMYLQEAYNQELMALAGIATGAPDSHYKFSLDADQDLLDKHFDSEVADNPIGTIIALREANTTGADIVIPVIVGLKHYAFGESVKHTIDIVITPSDKVILAEGSKGTAGDGEITGLESGKYYKVIMSIGNLNGEMYVKSDGTLTDDIGDIGALAGTEIIGITTDVPLHNGLTYKVIEAETFTGADYMVYEYTSSSASAQVGTTAAIGADGIISVDLVDVDDTEGIFAVYIELSDDILNENFNGVVLASKQKLFAVEMIDNITWSPYATIGTIEASASSTFSQIEAAASAAGGIALYEYTEAAGNADLHGYTEFNIGCSVKPRTFIFDCGDYFAFFVIDVTNSVMPT